MLFEEIVKFQWLFECLLINNPLKIININTIPVWINIILK